MEPEGMEGQWWLPDSPMQRRFGRVDSDASWKLLVEGGLVPVPLEDSTVALSPMGSPAFERRELIHGTPPKGLPITLIGCQSIQLRWPMEPQREIWHLDSIVEGAHLDDADELMAEVRVQLGNLRTWTCATGPTFTHQIGEATARIVDEELGSAVVGDATVSLVADHAVSANADRATLERRAHFRVLPTNGISLREAMIRFVFPLRNLVAFSAMAYTSVEPIFARQLAPREEPALPLTYRTQLQRPHRDAEEPMVYDMLLTLPQVSIGFESLIGRWFDLNVSHGKVINMMLMPTWAPYLYSDDVLMSAFIATESYHEASIGGTAIPADEHDERVRAIVESTPAEHRAWLKNVISGKNSKGQERKLREVVERAGSTGEAICNALPSFTAEAAKCRHKIAHPSAYDSGQGQSFTFVASGLRWLLRHCLLLDLGFTEDETTARISPLHAFQRDLDRLSSLRQPIG